MHGLTQVVVATECKRQIAHTSAYACSRKILLDPLRSTDKIERITIMLTHARSNGQHIGIKYYIAWGEAHLLGQNTKSPLANLNAALKGCCLTLLIEGHNDHSSTQCPHATGTRNEYLLALF